MPNINTEFVTKVSEPGDFRDERLLGFVLRVSKTGVKSYRVQGRVRGGALLAHTIGKHGAPWTAKQARDQAESILRLMKTGTDPRNIKESQRRADNARLADEDRTKKLHDLTLRTVFNGWSADERKTKTSTKNLYQDVLFKHLADWLDLPLYKISADMVTKRYDKIADTTISSANNCFRALRRLFNWAILEYRDESDKAMIESNPVSILSTRKKWRSLQSRKDFIANDDLPAWFAAVKQLPNDDFRDYFILTILTGLRRDESAGLKWRDIDFKRKAFTARDTKNGTDHTLPMTDYVYDLLNRREKNKGGEYVFAEDTKKGYIANVYSHQAKVTKASGVPFTPHTLRRTFSYAAAKVRLGDSERKALLNHLGKADVTDSHYTPWRIDDLREAIQMVENYILRHVTIDEQMV